MSIVLRRHQLAYLTAAGWRAVLAPLAAGHALHAWARRRLPLVVTRQVAGPSVVGLGWPGPLSAGRCRVAVQVARREVASFDEFPLAQEVAPLLPRRQRPAFRSLLVSLAARGLQPRVYGSYGWQWLSAQAYVHEASDVDLWLSVSGREQADEAVDALLLHASNDGGGGSVDGELLFPGGAAVAWREYAAWRAGRARQLLVKHLDRVALTESLPLPDWCEA